MIKKPYRSLLSLMMVISLILSGCGSSSKTDSPEKSAAEYESQIDELQQEIDELKAQLDSNTESSENQETTSAETAIADSDNTEEESVSETEVVPEEETISESTPSSETADTVSKNTEPEEDKMQIVVFGDSIWDSTRDETGVAYLLSQYTGADVYNCAIGGTCASLKPYEDDLAFDHWNSTSLVGMVNAAIGKVDPDDFMSKYVACNVFKSIDFSKTDYFIIAYGLNDYFEGRTISVSDTDLWNPRGYGGALRFAIIRLRAAYPNATIMLISPTYCQFWEDGVMYTDSNMKDFGGGPLTDYANHCRNVAENYETLFIDGYNTLGINIYNAKEYLADGIHLTAKGRELYAKAVSSCIKYGKPGQVSGNSVYY